MKRAARPTGLARALLAGALLALAPCGAALADRGTEQVALAATGRFDELERQLEAQAARGRLDTPDLHALCYAHSKTKRYAKLMACLDRLALNLQTGGRHTRLFALEDATPAMQIMRAEALVELGQYADAVAVATRAGDWLRQDDSDDLDMVCNALAVLSMAHTLGGARDKGLAAARALEQVPVGMLSAYASDKAMALARARMALGDYAGVIAALEGDRVFAVNMFLDKFASGSFITGVNNWAWVELPRAFMMAKALLETGRTEQARRGFERLLAAPHARQNGGVYWLLLAERGRLALRDKDYAGALAAFTQAIEVVEAQRASINTEATKIGFVGDKQALYAQAIASAMLLGESARVYDFMERAKSRALVDLLAARSGEALPRARTEAAREALESYRRAADEAAAQLPLSPRGTEAVAGNRGGADVAARAQELRRQDPALASLVSGDSLQLDEVRAYMAPDEVLLEYHMYGEQLVVMAVTGDEVAAATIGSAGLDNEIRRFRRQINEQDEAALASAAALYTRLLGPVKSLLAGRNLVLVPHGILHYLPFGALHDGAGYLVASRSLRYLPSASVHKYLRPQRQQAPDRMLILGNPDLGRAELDLPSAGQEAAMLGALVPASKILTRAAASETAFKQSAPGYRYLHVAAHGQFKGDSPLNSRLVLAPDGANDGSLTVGEIYALRLDADLVTLSACETGLTKAMNGDDLIGMTRGFLYAGSSNIVASLWPVDDVATAELMKQFYHNLKAGQSKKEALRGAQRSLWPRYAHPLFWGAFYLTGDGS
ncbi:CHAT domain-containing protein [Massilia glaciei]|uniref:CHAT domain-containing protein n=1 Tax=Massilia glaciei TaxID=1524097 RepID=A0A2U2HNJ2_9BURK|nr:CHAT domain-containing protein [Massilia glaciei]PWF49006.1 CHAT domain-containing protein [Massilia glaciei]